jgi:flagellar basal body-associated protein FliL
MYENDLVASEVQTERKSRKTKWILLSLVLLIVLGCSGAGYAAYGFWKAKEQEISNYHNELMSVAHYIISSAAIAEEIGNQYAVVWKQAINSKYGITVNNKLAVTFSQAVEYKREELIDEIEELLKDRKLLDERMRSLNKPPSQYQKAYDALIQMYISYTEYVELADSPSGSLVSFNEKRDQISSGLIGKYNEFKVLVPKLNQE